MRLFETGGILVCTGATVVSEPAWKAATRDAAAIIKWQKALGTLEPGKRADVVVIDGKQGDPYRRSSRRRRLRSAW